MTSSVSFQSEIVSFPSPFSYLKVSLPAPPDNQSSPSPPTIVSFPASAAMTSSPAPPYIVSFPVLPII